MSSGRGHNVDWWVTMVISVAMAYVGASPSTIASAAYQLKQPPSLRAHTCAKRLDQASRICPHVHGRVASVCIQQPSYRRDSDSATFHFSWSANFT